MSTSLAVLDRIALYAILVDAKHQCMTTRGIRKPDVATITTQFTGVFAEDPRMEARFLAMIGG